MDEVAGILVIVGLALLAMPVLLIVALVSLSSVKARVAELERRLGELQSGATRETRREPADPRAAAAAAASARAVHPAPGDAEEPTLSELVRRQARDASQAPSPEPAPQAPVPAPVAASVPAGEGPAVASTPPPLPPAPGRAPRPGDEVEVDAVTRARVAAASTRVSHAYSPPPPRENALLRAVKRWFTVGNVPVKIGMLVLLAGVAALLKYASDQGLFSLPLELRLAGVAAVALAALAFAWKRRESNRVFALSLQGGAIGVLLLTVYAAFRLYGILPAGAAFALSVVLVAGMGLLAVLQDAKALAVFALLAGFLAPIWLSTGSGNHVALFSYYAVLNAAIVAIAWFRSWRVLNLLGFAFTFGIGALWAGSGYRAEHYASTQPFLLLFFVFYLLVPILFARRQPEGRRDLIDGCLVFGTPLVAFSMQAGLLDSILPDGARMPLALCAVGLGALYAGLAWALLRRAGYMALGQAHAILAVGFATLAVPLALSARATASVFALEGAALAWLGLRQQRWLPQLTGAGLQLAAAAALFIGASQYWPNEQAIANPTFMGALLIALAGFASARAYRREERAQFALLYYLWGLLWWCGNAINEIGEFIAVAARADALLAFAAVTGWLAAEVHRKRPAPALALTTLAGFIVALPLALAQMDAHQQPFAGYGSWAWLVFAALGIRSLLCLRASEDRYAGWAQERSGRFR